MKNLLISNLWLCYIVILLNIMLMLSPSVRAAVCIINLIRNNDVPTPGAPGVREINTTQNYLFFLTVFFSHFCARDQYK
jgi:hypothetical protein